MVITIVGSWFARQRLFEFVCTGHGPIKRSLMQTMLMRSRRTSPDAGPPCQSMSGNVIEMFQVAIRLGAKMEHCFMNCPWHSEERLQTELLPRHSRCALTGCRGVCMASEVFNQYILGPAQQSDAELLRELFPDVSVAAKALCIDRFNTLKGIVVTN